MFLEKGLKKTILYIRSDRGGKFINHSFITYCKKNGIRHELPCPSTSQQNVVVERKSRTP